MSWADGDFGDRTVIFTVLDDGIYETLDEIFYVDLLTVENGEIFEDYKRTMITITGGSNINAGTLGFNGATTVVTEGVGSVIQIPVVRQGGSDGTASVAYTVTGIEATETADYTVDDSIRLEWTDQDATDKSIEITIVNDAVYEFDETLMVTLHTVENAELAELFESTISIVANDGMYYI